MNKYQYKVKGVDYDVEINEVEGNMARVTVNGIEFEVEMKQPIKSPSAHLHSHHQQLHPQLAAAAPTVQAQPQEPKATGAGSPLKSPLPGTITSVEVKVGDKVNEGDTVIVLEAMKMQNNIEAEQSGTVKEILVKQGDAVLEGNTLLVIG